MALAYPTGRLLAMLFKQNRIYNNTLSLKSQEMGCGVSSQSADNVSLPHSTPSTPLSKQDLYDRKDLIGVGHHGRVYRATHQLNNKEYAVKVIDRLSEPNPHLATKERKGLVERLKKLKNAFIIPYSQVEVREGEVSVVMELAAEGTLKKYIQKNGKLAQSVVSKIASQILQGLSYLHSNGIIHKDLKPSNILMTGNGYIQLSDYALAEIYDQRLSGKTDKGKSVDFSRGESLVYMPPEVIKHEGISEKSDIWSLGCTVIQMLTGKVPWSDINTKFQKAFIDVIARAVAPLPKQISSDCRAFLERCLLISPLKRSEINQLLIDPFIAYFPGPAREAVDNVKASMERIDTANRISSRNSNKKKEKQINTKDDKQQQQQSLKTPPSIEKSLQNQKIKAKDRYQIQKQLSESISSTDQLKKLKEAVGNFGKIKKSRDAKTIHNDDILPEIEEQEEGVMLNNRIVKLKPAQKLRTEQTDSSDKREYRNHIQLEDNYSALSLNDRSRIDSKNKAHYKSSESDSRVKLDTEPVLTGSQVEKDMEYFKKPLKLLKRKLKERQKNLRAKYIDCSDQVPSEPYAPEKDDSQNEQQPQQSKIRTLSQQREQIAINTQLAKAQRDRYINQQLAMRRHKEKEKEKWQEQLKHESQVIKKQFSHRYAYQRYHPVLNMI